LTGKRCSDAELCDPYGSEAAGAIRCDFETGFILALGGRRFAERLEQRWLRSGAHPFVRRIGLLGRPRRLCRIERGVDDVLFADPGDHCLAVG